MDSIKILGIYIHTTGWKQFNFDYCSRIRIIAVNSRTYQHLTNSSVCLYVRSAAVVRPIVFKTATYGGLHEKQDTGKTTKL